MFRFHRLVGNKRGGSNREDVERSRKPILGIVAVFLIFLVLVGIGSYFLLGGFSSPRVVDETGGIVAQNKVAWQNASVSGVPRAALIDALCVDYSNVGFTSGVCEGLRREGWEVDVFQGEVVTVDFLKNLSSGYRLVILRLHSALAASKELCLFTAERFSAGKYVQEQAFHLVKEAFPSEDSRSVFAVNWGFVKRLMAGKFNGTLVIATGCDSAVDSQIVREFMSQGAVGYVGWTRPVLLSHSDVAVLRLVEALFVEKLPLETAVEEVNGQVGADPLSSAVLKCFLP